MAIGVAYYGSALLHHLIVKGLLVQPLASLISCYVVSFLPLQDVAGNEYLGDNGDVSWCPKHDDAAVAAATAAAPAAAVAAPVTVEGATPCACALANNNCGWVDDRWLGFLPWSVLLHAPIGWLPNGHMSYNPTGKQEIIAVIDSTYTHSCPVHDDGTLGPWVPMGTAERQVG
jgi:hypothetical protein